MISMLRKLLRFSGKYAARIRLAYPVVFLKAVCQNAPIIIAVRLVGKLVAGAADINTVVISAAFLLLCFVLQSILQNIADRLQSGTGYAIFAEKRMELGRHLRKLPMGYFNSGNIGRISTVLSQDMVYIEEQSMMITAAVVSDVFAQAVITAYIFSLDIRAGAVVVATELAAMLTARVLYRIVMRNAAKRQDAIEALTGSVLEYIDGFSVSRSYNLGGESSKAVRKSFADMRDASICFESEYTPFERLLQIMYSLGTAAVLALCVYELQQGALGVEAFTGIMLFLFNIFAPVRHLYQQMNNLGIMNNSLDRIEALFAEKELDDSGCERPGEACGHELEFRDVSFAYGEERVLKNISFCADRGHMTALVGASGSGKSTVANLLARFWDISDGEILLRGTDIRKLPLSALMNEISMVFQKVYLFEDSVFNNIRMGRPEASREDVIEAAKKARCYDFIMRLPYGFDTVIGEGGADLSGGEAQRISIARCILKDAPIIILDEATASIDADNEACIQEAMTELCRGKTSIIIAHRLNTIRNADNIIVLDKGRIAEQGRHEELFSAGGLYALMLSSGASACETPFSQDSIFRYSKRSKERRDKTAGVL